MWVCCRYGGNGKRPHVRARQPKASDDRREPGYARGQRGRLPWQEKRRARRMGTGTRRRLTGACDMLIAAAAVLIIVAVHRPWFQSTLTPPDPAGLVTEPRGAATGLYAHGSLWIAIGV